MIGVIRRPNIAVVPFDPDNIFDPTTHVATETDFIKLLEHGVYDSKYIGYKVQLSNSVDYNNGLWVIADVNHDNINTGQSNCYDLISEDSFHKAAFSNSSPYSGWRSSTARTWLNNTFYPGFSTEFKNHILNPKYKSQSTWYTDDYVILPSKVEVNGETGNSTDNEGVAYPIFTGTAGTGENSSRKKHPAGSTSYVGYWWLRSRTPSDSNYFYEVYGGDGSIGSAHYEWTYLLAPLLRVS